ncbi:hypothetical protein [Polymorphum gilvum]|uniref:hypothetical protein n=1 Tax=Polymorphum gilvum TaxID=991904 RepID=UPI001F582AD6|nr:hypothetical protein [Polymorphum gilvum]
MAPAPAVPAAQATFAFEPFTGAPGNIADDLSRAIGTKARVEGLTLVRRVGADASYRVKGYLSATGDPSASAIFYVFDIFDANGVRMNRITGTEAAPGVNGDPWESADSDTLDRIAARAVLAIKAWLHSR